MERTEITYEHEVTEPMRVENDNEGSCYVRGYADAYQGKPLNTPKKHVNAYLRGYIAGLLARRE